MSSTDEEEETDEGSQVKVANYPVPPNLNGTLHGGGSSKSVCVTPSRTYSEKQSQRCYIEETGVGSDTSASKRSRPLDSPSLSINTVHSESNLGPDDGISTFGHHPTSSYQLQELVTNNLTDSRIQSLESKMDHFIKLAVMNNRLIKEQQKSLDVIDGKFNQLLNRGTEAGFPIQNQTFGVDDERILEFKKIIPLSTEDDFNKLEEILLSESNEFKDCVVRFLSLGGSNQYKEAVRRIMASVLTDQVSVLYSYRGHKGKKVFQTKELSKLIISEFKNL
ncbi:hypothetical protein RN001_002474 [Aquatica leii]|uniref:DUF4806 domain-containing protein n=1 Tax=Aquatica leii TaxID=1421715 RepID=A0AAN7QNI7_9COLE|nr:hypothetical protein RN001_002474 [Aquatica leii]